MKGGEGDAEKNEISAFSRFMADYLKNIERKTEIPENPQTENFWKIRKITIPHICADIEPLIGDAGILIEWLYANNHKTRQIRPIPQEARGSLDTSTIAGILWRLGRKTRPRAMPAPFFCVYGKWLITEDGVIRLVRQKYIALPCPPLPPGSSIRWIIVRAHDLDVFIREPFTPPRAGQIPAPASDAGTGYEDEPPS